MIILSMNPYSRSMISWGPDPKELGGPSKRRHPSIKALRKLGLRTALEAAREMRGETIEDC